ncbi:hypothetical protein F1559_005061 [Cyanidiococcus yangmingshanensis]|uniref:J domain-containing protein n=1 Tax=Cyanidiococcus yangmingshanensis TaxID=2690220 RepID=A0A7J7IQR9_9RHOD|nr:hypothetical protein F1559_005061 [Cyanidiococcus yangmingshanensis]
MLLQNESAPVPESAFICVHCGRIQPNLPPDVDYFALFGIPERFLLDESLLERRFREWQRRLHPDNAHAQALHAEKASALVNAAHDVLKSPHSRALYMLAERGVTLEPEHDDVTEQREMAPEFLEEMLALREQLDEAAQSQEGLRTLASWISEAKSRVCRELDEAFEQSSQSTDESMRRCRDLAARLQFYNRLEMAAKERL